MRAISLRNSTGAGGLVNGSAGSRVMRIGITNIRFLAVQRDHPPRYRCAGYRGQGGQGQSARSPSATASKRSSRHERAIVMKGARMEHPWQ